MGIISNIFKKKRMPKFDEEPPKPAFEVVKSHRGDYNDFESKLKKYSLIILINGKRGSGKTALGMKFLEFFKENTKRKTYAMGFDNVRLPFGIKKANTIEDIANNAVALIDEGAIAFSSRDSMKASNKNLGKLMAVARHKNFTPILITQNSGMIDLNVLRLTDTIILKEPSLLQSQFERKAIKDLYGKAIPHFEDLDDKKAHFYVIDDEFEGLMNFSLPSFWSDKISKSFKNK